MDYPPIVNHNSLISLSRTARCGHGLKRPGSAVPFAIVICNAPGAKPMDAEEILRELAHAEGLPEKALKAASSRRVEMLPVFLNEIETCVAQQSVAPAKPTLLFFIFHLLGEWRQKTAYRPLARLVRLPCPEGDAIFRDAVTATRPRGLAGGFEG